MATIKQQETFNYREVKAIINNLSDEDRLKIALRNELRNEKERWSSIYIIKCHDFYKIGLGWNVKGRLEGMQVGNPYLLELIFSIKHPKAKEIEPELHKYYKNKGKSKRGEWFLLEQEDIEAIKTFMENSLSEYELQYTTNKTSKGSV